MHSRIAGIAAGITLAAASLGYAAAAHATIVDIDSKTTGVTVVIDPGQYRIEYIGTADGGAFNGWNPNCTTGDCTSGWREAFGVITDPNPNPDLDIYGAGGLQSSALAALAAARASAFIVRTTLSWNGSGYAPSDQEFIAQPWTVNLGAPLTVHFFIPDPTREDNYGGVSLRIAAVPEPATWALMILGLGGAGTVLRSRRRSRAAMA